MLPPSRPAITVAPFNRFKFNTVLRYTLSASGPSWICKKLFSHNTFLRFSAPMHIQRDNGLAESFGPLLNRISVH